MSASPYSPQVMAAMFEAVEMNDVVDPVVSLPDPLPLVCTEADIRACFALCRQFWEEGAARTEIAQLLGTLMASGDLPRESRVRYKHIRASYKQLRFASVLYGKRHKAPLLFRWTVALMGHLQDAFRNGRRMTVLGHVLLLRLLVTWPIWALVRREIAGIELDDAAGFLAFRRAEFAKLRRWMEGGHPTGHVFHMMRKVVSRQVSFYDSWRTVAPDEDRYRMSRFLSAINGLMGSLHDDLVEQTCKGLRDYHRDDVVLPEDIDQRLRTLAAALPE